MNAMLNVLINAYAVSPNWGSEPGMGWNWIINIARYCNVFVITEGEWQKDISIALKQLPYKANIHFYYNPLSPRIRQMCWNQGDWRFYWYYRKWQKRTLKIAEQIVSKHKIDIIHQLNMIGFREPGYLWELKDIPFVWGPIGGMELMPTGYFRGVSFTNRMKTYVKNIINELQRKHDYRTKKVLNKSALLFAATKGVYETIKHIHEKEVILLNETGCYCSNVCDREMAKVPQNNFDIIWVGKFDYRKQLELALHAVGKLKNIASVTLHVIGSGSEKQIARYHQLVDENEIGDLVVWHGKIPNKEVHSLMRKADILLFTSIMEGTPHVVLEALQNNLPVVCFDTCGQADVVNDNVGIKVPITNTVQSIEDFARVILQLYHNPRELNSLKNNCFERQKELAWENKAATMVDYYHKAISQYKTKSANP